MVSAMILHNIPPILLRSLWCEEFIVKREEKLAQKVTVRTQSTTLWISEAASATVAPHENCTAS